MATVTGGSKMMDALRRMERNVRKAKSVKVGYVATQTYPDGTSLPMVAAINEYGAPSRGQPPRPFFRNMIAKHKSEWPEAMAAALRMNDYDAAKALGLVGEAIKGQLQQSIRDFTDPPNAPSTIRAKGHDHPLIDTRFLLQNPAVEIEK